MVIRILESVLVPPRPLAHRGMEDLHLWIQGTTVKGIDERTREAILVVQVRDRGILHRKDLRLELLRLHRVLEFLRYVVPACFSP
jgi:hypothetical protein